MGQFLSQFFHILKVNLNNFVIVVGFLFKLTLEGKEIESRAGGKINLEN